MAFLDDHEMGANLDCQKRLLMASCCSEKQTHEYSTVAVQKSCGLQVTDLLCSAPQAYALPGPSGVPLCPMPLKVTVLAGDLDPDPDPGNAAHKQFSVRISRQNALTLFSRPRHIYAGHLEQGDLQIKCNSETPPGASAWNASISAHKGFISYSKNSRRRQTTAIDMYWCIDTSICRVSSQFQQGVHFLHQ